jgi:hypothetical protein
VRPPGVEKTSRLGSRDPVANEVKCGSHGGKNNRTKSWMVSWLSLKTKVEPGLRRRRVMSGDGKRLHRARWVCSGSPENHWVPRLSHKTEAEDSTMRCATQADSTTQEERSYCVGRSNRLGEAV